MWNRKRKTKQPRDVNPKLNWNNIHYGHWANTCYPLTAYIFSIAMPNQFKSHQLTDYNSTFIFREYWATKFWLKQNKTSADKKIPSTKKLARKCYNIFLLCGLNFWHRILHRVFHHTSSTSTKVTQMTMQLKWATKIPNCWHDHSFVCVHEAILDLKFILNSDR